jgi:hypothetical protein
VDAIAIAVGPALGPVSSDSDVLSIKRPFFVGCVQRTVLDRADVPVRFAHPSADRRYADDSILKLVAAATRGLFFESGRVGSGQSGFDLGVM